MLGSVPGEHCEIKDILVQIVWGFCLFRFDFATKELEIADMSDLKTHRPRS